MNKVNSLILLLRNPITKQVNQHAHFNLRKPKMRHIPLTTFDTSLQ